MATNTSKGMSFMNVIRAQRQNQEVPAMDLTRDIQLSSTLSKLVQDTSRPMRDSDGNRQLLMPDLDALSEISENKIDDINHADTVMQLLPDNELGAQILVSSILSPKDMGETSLTFTAPSEIVPGKTAASLTNIIKDYFKENYKIESKLQEWLRAILFEKGSYPLVVIPENSLDEIITNGRKFSMESLASVYDVQSENMQPIGLLGKADEYSLETGKIKPKASPKGLGISLEQYDSKDITAADSSMYIAMEKHDYQELYAQAKKQGVEKTQRKKEYEFFDPCISVTDNPAILSISALKDRLRAESVKKTVYGNPVRENSPILDRGGLEYPASAMEHPRAGLEHQTNLSDDDIENLLYQRVQYKTAPILSIKTSEQAYRESVGEPLILHIPPEAIIPVFIPGSPSQHVGYYVILDNNGYPISKESNVDHYQELNEMTAAGKRSMASVIAQRAQRMFEGRDLSKRRRLDTAMKTYTDLIEKDLISRLRNGIYGQSVKIGTSTEIARIMFSRSLMQQHTQILFIPAEMMTYMAFRYDDNGVGVSLLDNLKIINSLRVALMLAGVRASVMNSIPRTKVRVKLDPNDPNPIKRREQFVHEYRMLRQAGNNGMPMGTTNPAVIEQWANQAGVEFAWEGHPDIPDMDVDISEYASSVAQPDTDLREQMDKIGILGIGLTPEVVDGAKGAEFATTITHNNLLLTRRVAQYQEAFNPQVAAHVRKHTLNSPFLRRQMLDILMNDFDEIMTYLSPDDKTDYSKIQPPARYRLCEKLLETFMNKFQVTLPKPNSAPLERKREDFQSYMESIDATMEYVLSTETLPEGMIGELNNAIDMAKSVARAHFAREWMLKNDYMSEMLDLLSTDETGEPIYNLWELNAQYGESMAKALATFIDKVKDLKRTGDQYMQSNDQEEDLGGGDYSSSDSGSDSSSESSGGDDFGLGNDAGFGGDDFSMDVESSEEKSDNPDKSDLDEGNPDGM